MILHRFFIAGVLSLCLSISFIGCQSDLAPSQTPTTQTTGADNSRFASGVPTEILLSMTAGEPAQAKFWPASTPRPSLGIIFVSGVDGGFVEPVDGIYDRIAEALAPQGVASIFVRYHDPGNLEPSVQDALAAAEYLRALGVKRMAIAGWSFGGAVMVNSAVRVPEIATVIGFAPQSEFTEAVQQFRSQSILLFHSDQDENVPFNASSQILAEVPEGIRTQFHPISGADHLLQGQGPEIDPVVMDWLKNELISPEATRAALESVPESSLPGAPSVVLQ